MAEETTGKEAANSRIRHYASERCAADLAYQPGDTELSCAYCGFRVDIGLKEDAEVPERDLESELFRQSRTRDLRGLEPWPLDELAHYDPKYLVGHLAKTYDVDLSEAWKRARQRIEANIEHEVLERIGGDTSRIDDMETRWDALKYRHLLLPVYLVSIRDRERIHQIVISGANGKVIGERPYSLGKIVIAATVLYALGALAFRLHALL
jgi:hypothetical protein